MSAKKTVRQAESSCVTPWTLHRSAASPHSGYKDSVVSADSLQVCKWVFVNVIKTDVTYKDLSLHRIYRELFLVHRLETLLDLVRRETSALQTLWEFCGVLFTWTSVAHHCRPESKVYTLFFFYLNHQIIHNLLTLV